MSKTTGLEIAVIGMACRFPGAKNIEEFWENIKTGTESITFFSKEELMEAGVPKEQLDHKNYVRAKGKVDLHDHFDAAFFGYSQREAEVMDPQVRMFHEVAWESLENAGYNPETYSQPIGLFGAASANLYWQASSMLLRSSSSSEQFAAVQLTDKDFMNTQISYKLNLKGPSIAVDTACSSSLTAVHLASRALLTGDCKMALAGGVTVTCPHKKGYMYQEGMIMSPDGRCRAFDAEAKGTVGGEGCGVVVLKTLKQALKDQDHIYAVIKGSAYNNDGSRKVGYTAPSIEGQADVIRKALNISRVESESISYVEAHGTGTSLGDPVEIEALKQAFQTEKKQFCAIGSVKTNIGHLDSAAGIAGFIKTALSLKARTLPPSLHYKKPNPKIDFENSPFYVSTSAKQWTASDQVFRAGVSSFGIGGTNVHVVMEEPPMKERRHQEDHEDCLMLISARSEKAAMKAADQVKQFIKENEEVPLQDVSYTLQEGRRHFQYRQAFTAGPLGITSDMENSSIALEKPAVVFMFSGQGSQYVNMGKQLYEMEPVFQEELERCFTILQAEEGLNIRSIMFPANEAESIEAEQLIHETSYTQPILFSFEYALASFLNKKGLKPQYMIGHSIGELTAACLSGICSLEDALHMVAMRGQLMQEMPEGEMLSVRLSSRETEMELTEGVELSASNSSDLSVVSGLMEPINAFAARLQAKGVAIQHLKTSHAFHSSMMKPAASRFADILQDMEFKAPGLPFISNVTGDWIQAEQAADPKYWASQIMEKVDFHSGLNTLLQMGNVVFVEIGPGNTLTQFVRKHEGFMTEQHAAVNMIRHPKEVSSDRVYLLNRIGRLWTHGVNMNWEHFRQGGSYERVPLPTYPFEHQVFPDPQTSQGGMEEKIKNELKLNVASSEKQLPFDKWFSVPFWERMEPVNETFTHQGKRILVFEENSNVSQYLLKQQAEAVSVQPGDYFAETDRNTFTVNHRDTAHSRKLLDELNARGFIPDEIIWMWLQDCDGRDGDIAEHTIAGYLPLLDLVRLLGTESNKRFSMTVVTNQAHDVTGMEDLQPHQAALTGVCLTIPQEYKQISCKAVDLCPDPRLGQSSWPEMISYELKKEDDQPIVAYRGNSRWIRQAKQPGKQDEIDMAGNLRHKGVYIITGGLGGIGLSLASHLAETVQAKLVLLSRTGLPDKLRENDDTAKKLKAVEELEKAGAEVLVLQADISDEAELQKALQTVESRFGQAIHGVIHAAGIPDGKVIHARTPDDERHMAKAKITGTALLRKALRNKQPDFFFICSSLVSFLGAGGQVGYAASNAFLDSYAHACRKEGENMVTVNWDRWEQVGMAYESETAAILSKIADKEEQHQGILPAQGAKAFMRALQLRYPQVLISLQDVNKRMKDSYVKEDRQTAAHVLTKDRLDTLEERLMNIFKDYFHSETDVNMNFFELGASSLDLLQVSGRIKNELGVDIPVVMMYAHPTVASLTQAVKAQQSGDDLHIKGIEPDRQKAINEGKNRRKQRMRRK
ncbi:type I polyketide synthase [Bacillus inaquosorum]|uniref:type I polyketide synthase n=1 Tax=Bacillus inaquosorum TaxID=483913 RepID=UPI00227EE583|nr:type I polyketide synthase [Bacillus inaquosorum]MCY7979658.1 type I polyketide synthase [Bacillus inaquosorum]MCY8280434.1 type I polyketide synthase [Bacillus inaquosorum]MCY8753857.1 type I polyketide synthase [Bacillus inaquosorum]MCY9341517.1 type I polyketide synthase [Bacillus inaquosorum]MEC0680956.1 type I polyketide synthase [Bacillus inaquosorum]